MTPSKEVLAIHEQFREHWTMLNALWTKPEPGAICPTCGEKTPNKHALEVRAWRAKSKTRGTEEKR